MEIFSIVIVNIRQILGITNTRNKSYKKIIKSGQIYLTKCLENWHPAPCNKVIAVFTCMSHWHSDKHIVQLNTLNTLINTIPHLRMTSESVAPSWLILRSLLLLLQGTDPVDFHFLALHCNCLPCPSYFENACVKFSSDVSIYLFTCFTWR